MRSLCTGVFSVLAATVPLLATMLCLETSPANVSDEGPLSAEEAARQFELPPGFTATLFAGEPDVVQPIAFTIDHRGRLWVLECLSYPGWTADGTGRDRIVIFEDRDGDGRYDDRKVFWDRGSNLSGIELGFGGVWLCSTPNLIFLPDHDRDDVPDGEPEILLDGWDLNSKHNVFNGLTWGPDGWLYGCNGILGRSLVGTPGAPEEERVLMSCGVWRFHPTRHEFEVVANGTTNPWGLDFNEHGQMFITNCVIEHVFHVVPGAHMKRMYGQDPNPNVYELMQTCADHIHWGGGFWDTSIGGIHNAFGGGHAHAGCMIYQGDNWPDEFRGGLFTLNIHGRRANHDTLERSGSGYVARHQPDFALSADPWFRGLELKSGPDGAVYVTDWNDTGECHDYEHTQKQTGRIFKITYGRPEHLSVDLSTLSDLELAELVTHDNEWHVRTARRLLQERAGDRNLDSNAVEHLHACLADGANSVHRLHALWVLHATDELPAETRRTLIHDKDEYLQAWSVRLEAENAGVNDRDFWRAAAAAESPHVALEVASALQRGGALVLPVADQLVERAQDAGDRLLPLMIWYGIEPLIGMVGDGDLRLMRECRIPLVQRCIARRITEQDGGLARIVDWLATDRPERLAATEIVAGMRQALEGRRTVPMPQRWPAALAGITDSADEQTRADAMFLALLFDDAEARQSLTEAARNTGLEPASRRQALASLIAVPHPSLQSEMLALLDDPDVADLALRGLAYFDEADVAGRILARYDALNAEQQQTAIATLAAHESSALALVAALEAGTLPREDVSAYVARQLLAFNNTDLSRRLQNAWGQVRASSADRQQRLQSYAAELTTDALATADASRGRTVFNSVCAKCHKLFGEGASIGPDLTGSQRSNVDYLLQNLVDPSAAVPREYRMHTVLTTDGRLINGVMPAENERTITLQTPTERIVIDRDDIEDQQPSNVSMMPEGLLDAMTAEQRRDLFAYLMSARG